jgi:hypothetical protein
MAGTQSRYAWQFKQRLTSNGLNLQTSYLARNTSELGRYLAGGTDQELALQTGVIRGFVPAVVPATLKISIGPGLGQFFSSGISEPDSKAQWMELRASKEVTTTAGDAANPRWDVVEIQPAAVDAVAEIIDFFNPADNTFSPAVVVVQKLAEVAAQVRQGTPNANPKLPAGVAGWIPLCYVYVAANALALNVDRVMFCRPILTPRRGTTPDNVTGLLSQIGENLNISGGGWRIEADGLAGFLNTAMSGTFPLWGRPFYLPAGAAVSLSATGNYVGGGLPLASTTVYAYVAPPPYPSGYDATLAPRELFIADNATPNVSATIPAGARGCIVVAGSGAPNEGSPLGQRGSPTTTHSFVDNLWGAFDLRRSDMLYIGAAYYDFALPGLITQRVHGSWIAPKRKVGFLFDADLPIVAPATYFLTGFPGFPMSFPATAKRVSMQVACTLAAGASLHCDLQDEWTGVGGNIASGSPQLDLYNDAAGSETVTQPFEAVLTDSLSIIIEAAAGNGVISTAGVTTRAYEDEILSMR